MFTQKPWNSPRSRHIGHIPTRADTHGQTPSSILEKKKNRKKNRKNRETNTRVVMLRDIQIVTHSPTTALAILLTYFK